jgi:YidC/Oxa1 family membrane protein insertase
VLAANVFFDPLVHALSQVLTGVHSVVPSYGWALIALALVVRIVLWPLAAMQFRSMAEMQKVQPLIKQIQAKYKGDQQGQNQAMMALYKEHNVNPLAGCLPMLLQFPILIGLYWAIQSRIGDFKTEHWLWIGSPIAPAVNAMFHQPILATSLAVPDVFLLVLYVVSMYFTVRYGSPPSTDPQQAQTQKIMAFVSPAMIAFFGFKYRWASALYIYWLATNVFTVAQQFYMFRKFGIGRPAAVAATAVATGASAAKDDGGRPGGKIVNGDAATNGKRTYRPKKRSRR